MIKMIKKLFKANEEKQLFELAKLLQRSEFPGESLGYVFASLKDKTKQF